MITMNMNNPFVKKSVADQWIRFITNRDIVGTLNQQYFEKILKNHRFIASNFLSLADCGLPSFFVLCEIFKI